MVPEFGQLALALALALALLQGTLPLIGAARGMPRWMAVARPAAQMQALAVALAFACLVASFVRHDFSVLNVAEHSNRALPLVYRICAAWGSHEGSMLLWLLMLSGWTLAVAQCSRGLPLAFVARVLAVLGLVASGFIAFVLVTSNPFTRLVPAAIDGNDLNPLLQDPGMIIHPPLLYMGYVGLAVGFAFAVAALLAGRLDATWARWTRPWITAAWAFLTLGIMLGSWWAYHVLGWGGWWFWDPVENASFMPWLAATALIHSLAVTEKRGAFKAWTVLLAIVAFALSLLGTFIVRSGVLTSVHAFAVDPQRGLFILALLALAVGAALALYAWRAPAVGLGGRFDALSRETLLLANNLLFVVATLTVLLGTLYPLALDALGLGKLSVGAPYFEAVMAPLLGAAALLLGIGPLARWKGDALPSLARRLRVAALVTLSIALAPAWFAGLSLAATLGVAMSAWIAATVCTDIVSRGRQASRATAGMWLAHVGVAVFTLGVVLVNALQVERDVALKPDASAELAGMTFTLRGFANLQGPNYDAVQAIVSVSQAGRAVAELRPEKRLYRVQRNPMTEAAVQRNLTRDVFVSLGEPVGDGAWLLRLYVKPFVAWIWAGCVLMALGGFVAVSDRRYRVRRTQTEPAAEPLVVGITA
ncbi:MAG: heme lyase CcmF/NrfE family subunit [Pseudomonadota bacterium]